MARNTRNIHLDVSLQRIIKQKQSLLDLKQKFYDTIGGSQRLPYYLENDIEEFTTYWNELVSIVNEILDFCNRHGIILEYRSENTTIADWLRVHPRPHGNYTLLELFRKYLISDFISALPEGSEREFATHHRNAIHKIEDLISIVAELN
jgi:hypothetical protein